MENVETQGLARGPQSVGSQLRAAREAAGKTRSDIATHTKIAERHLAALEDDRLGDLAARTYAVGFARAYARAVGLDERRIAAQVREQLDQDTPGRPETPPSFEPGDPARVPTRRVAWVAALGVIAVVAVLLVFWSNYLSPEGELPELVAEKTAAPAQNSAVRRAAPQQAAVPTGPVVLTATGDRVWVKITDANGGQVLQKELARGESWTAPGDVAGLKLRTGRPDALQITVGGKDIPPLATEPRVVSGVSLAASDLLARSNPVASPSQGAIPAASPGPVAAISGRPVAIAERTIRREAATQRPAEVPRPESLLPASVQ